MMEGMNKQPIKRNNKLLSPYFNSTFIKEPVVRDNKILSPYFNSKYLTKEEKKEALRKTSKRYDNTINGRYKRYKCSAKRRNLVFELDRVQCETLFTSPCHYCGEMPVQDRLNGIDRYDNLEGYKLNNTVSCCRTCNMIKGKLDVNDFINKCCKIAKRFDL